MKISYIFFLSFSLFAVVFHCIRVLRCFILLTTASLLITSIFSFFFFFLWRKLQSFFFDGSCFLHQLNYFAFDWFSSLGVSKVAKAVAYLTDSARTYFRWKRIVPEIYRVDQFWRVQHEQQQQPANNNISCFMGLSFHFIPKWVRPFLFYGSESIIESIVHRFEVFASKDTCSLPIHLLHLYVWMKGMSFFSLFLSQLNWRNHIFSIVSRWRSFNWLFLFSSP